MTIDDNRTTPYSAKTTQCKRCYSQQSAYLLLQLNNIFPLDVCSYMTAGLDNRTEFLHKVRFLPSSIHVFMGSSERVCVHHCRYSYLLYVRSSEDLKCLFGGLLTVLLTMHTMSHPDLSIGAACLRRRQGEAGIRSVTKVGVSDTSTAYYNDSLS